MTTAKLLNSSSSRNRVASWHVRLNLRCLVIGTFYTDESNKLSRRLQVACKHSARCGRTSWIRWHYLESDPTIFLQEVASSMTITGPASLKLLTALALKRP